jgi:hypothetical protein
VVVVWWGEFGVDLVILRTPSLYIPDAPLNFLSRSTFGIGVTCGQCRVPTSLPREQCRCVFQCHICFARDEPLIASNEQFPNIDVLSPPGSPPFTSEPTYGLSILAITVLWNFMCASSFRRATCARCSRPTSGRWACHQRPHSSNSYIFMREDIYNSPKNILSI